MSEILLLHHALGLTDGVRAFAERLRAAGHLVHTPDLFDGHVFPALAEGLAYAQRTDSAERGVRAADNLPPDLVYIGISLGVMPAQRLTQTRPGARAAVLLEACVPPDAFDAPWPPTVPVQIHGMDADPFFAGDGDLDAARALVKEAPGSEVHVYPGDQHLFTDSSLPSYDAAATDLAVTRILTFLRPTA
ncbi:dienelactone hydrolase family protein [Paractinoplanes ferrugineus]|uniref:Dienelactone hydrolase n=1 Tax=Paractinoplanes ferrugineus TaxID=113564 RepID=A0A919J9M0_9ACTN|nr:dienelactone hydrolase family protein [Actinoplanes ferrugineus]GIE15822.1 dienelactone hydrolase [Actinoplanes ferrugineus]